VTPKVPAEPVVAPDVAVKPADKPDSKLIAEPPAKPAPAISASPSQSAETLTVPPKTPLPLAKAAPEPAPFKPVVHETVSPKASPTAPQLQQKVTIMAATAFKGYEDFTAFGKDNFDAFVQANAVFAKGFEDFSKEVLSLTQASMEGAASAAKAMFSAKTLKDVVELNTELTKTNIEKLVANSSKLSELGMKVTTEALAPINARVNVAVEKILKPAV
jgi:phasin family protein